MSDDLVKRLRVGPSMLAQEEAADRIEELEAKLAKAVNIASLALNGVSEVQTYKQPHDPWSENALTMRELEVFDFDVESARTTLAEMLPAPVPPS